MWRIQVWTQKRKWRSHLLDHGKKNMQLDCLCNYMALPGTTPLPDLPESFAYKRALQLTISIQSYADWIIVQDELCSQQLLCTSSDLLPCYINTCLIVLVATLCTLAIANICYAIGLLTSVLSLDLRSTWHYFWLLTKLCEVHAIGWWCSYPIITYCTW